MTFTVRHGIDGPNRNRWFTEPKKMVIKWWIFPWLTVNVITRWYVNCPPGPARPLDLAAPEHDAR